MYENEIEWPHVPRRRPAPEQLAPQPPDDGPERSHPNCWTGTEYAHECHEPSGRECIEQGCTAAAGTPWGPYWCPDHDVARLDRISENLTRFVSEG